MKNEFVLYDTEFTSWEGCVANGWDVKKNQYRELIQIGAIKVDANTFEIIDSFQSFCKPVLNPQLSDYIIKLTGIAQTDVDSADSFPNVPNQFFCWIGESRIFAYGGDYDVLKENALHHKIAFTIPQEQATNLKILFKEHGFPIEKYNSGILPTYYGIETIGKEHTALADSMNILLALTEMKKRREFLPVLQQFNF